YVQSPDNGRSILKSEQEYGNDAKVDQNGNVTGSSLPAQTFTADSATPASPWSVSTSTTPHGDVPTAGGFTTTFQTDASAGALNYRMGDFTGTGKTGLALLENEGGCIDGSVNVLLMRTASGPETPSTLSEPTLGHVPTCVTSEWWALDMNGDG